MGRHPYGLHGPARPLPMDVNRRGGAVLAAPPRLTPVHNIKLTETRRDYALSVGASGRGGVRPIEPVGPDQSGMTVESEESDMWHKNNACLQILFCSIFRW